MSDIAFPSFAEMLRNTLSWSTELVVALLSCGAIVALPVAGAIVTRQRAHLSSRKQAHLGRAAFVAVVVLIAITGAGLFDVTLFQLELIPWLTLGLIVVGGPWLWWVTTTKPKTTSTKVALATVYFSALMVAIGSALAYQ